MTACCDTDVTVFGHTQPDCPDTQIPRWQADAYTERIRLLDQLAQRSITAEIRLLEAYDAARPDWTEPELTVPAVVATAGARDQIAYACHRLRQLARSQP